MRRDHRQQRRAATHRRLLPAVGVLLAGMLLTSTASASVAVPASAQSVASARQEADRLTAELADLRQRSADAIVRLEHAEDDLGRAVGRSATLARELDRARAVAGGTERQLSRRVSALYRSGGSLGVWASLLTARTPAELAARKVNVDKVVAVDAQRRDASAAGADEMAALEDSARRAASEQVSATAAAEAHAAELTDLLTRQQAALDRATERVRALVEQERRAAAAAAAAELARQQAARLAAEQAAQQAQLVAAARAARPAGTASGPPPAAAGSAAATAPAVLPGGGGGSSNAYVGPPGACPVGAVHSFTDTWHAPRSGGRKHQGTDVFAPHGSPAYAVVDGVITKWGDGGLGGITLWLRGDDGTRYYYAHNAANVAPVGSRVRAGQLVAYVGTTGNARTTPPHIHFEAHPVSAGGVALNPYPWLAAICGH